MNEACALRVVVVDDSDVVRMKLRQLLVEPGFEVVGEAPDGATGLQVIAHEDPDVVVMDLQMPGMSGIDATWRLGGICPDTKVLMLTVSDDEDDVADAVMAGAKGYVLKGSTETEITNAVRQVASGQSVISPEVANVLVCRGTGRDELAEGEAQPDTPEPAVAAPTVLAVVPDPQPPVAAVPDPEPHASTPPPPRAPYDHPPLTVAEQAPYPHRPSAPHPEHVPRLLTIAVVLIGGFALAALGQGAAILEGDASAGTLLRVALDFAVAYALWHGGVMAAGRRAPFGWGRDRHEDMDRAPVFE